MSDPVSSPISAVSSPAFSMRDVCHVSLLVLVTFLLYSNTLTVPWYYDDITSIIEQPYLHGFDQVIRLLLSFRGVAKLTFVLNNSLGGLYLPGFHLVNIAVHAGSVIVFYLILKRVFRGFQVYPFLGALLFAVHPVQTQAVTYIVQRMTSLSGFFFLLSLYLYIRFREKCHSEPGTFGMISMAFWAAAFLTGALALFSKENAVVLPVALYLFDWFFLDGRSEKWTRLLMRTFPFAIIPCLFAGFFFLVPLYKGAGVDSLTKTATTIVSSRDLTPWTYFITQFSVIWTYIRILIAPYGITLDYCYPVVKTLLMLRSIVAGVGLAGLLGFAFRVRHSAPRISFGIAWFFLTLSVESSFIPLDPLFIHRLYLPVAGFVIVLMDVLILLPWRRVVLALFCIVISIYSVVTWQRNALWNDPVAFYEDNLRKAPHSERVRNLLAEQYLHKGRDEDSKRMLIEAIRINPAYGSSIVALSNMYINEGRKGEAFELLENGLRINPNDHELHNSLGSLYSMIGRNGMAEYHLRRAIALKPQYGRAYCNLGVHYTGLGRWKEAESQYRMALNVTPNDPMIHYNLGVALLGSGQHDAARYEFNQALKFDPKDKNLIYNLTLAWIRLGDQQAANGLLVRLRGISREMADKLESEMKSKK
ncbi:MAG: tetratricopeptide repeat protein [Pelobacteraceae bacterium]